MHYAVSDIHGCFDELMDLLEAIDFTANDELYILGDLIDRGPKSGELVYWLLNAPDNVHFQWGNHEQMMVWSLAGDWRNLELDGESSELWMHHGGKQTYEQLQMLDEDSLDAFQQLIAYSPNIRSVKLPDTKVILVHAGLQVPNKQREIKLSEINEQVVDDLLWITWSWICSECSLPVDVVFGHMPTTVIFSSGKQLYGCSRDQYLMGSANRVMSWNRRHAIDGACVHGGNLCALRLEDWEDFHVPCHKKGGYWH